MRRSERAVLVGIVTVVALVLRCGFVATSEVAEPLRADAGQYAQCAQNLVEHGVFSLATTNPPPPDSFRSPGYPALLAVCRWLGGEQGWYALARWLQVVLSTAVVPLAFLLARSLLPFGGALAAAVVVALSPHLVIASGYVLTEVPFACALALAFALLARAQRGRAPLPFAAAGLAFGLAALVNEALSPLPFVFALLQRRRWGARAAVAFALAAALPIGGWALRNATTPLARTGGQRALATLSHGSYPQLFFRTEPFRNYPYREDPEQPAYGEQWDRFRAVFTQRFRAEPARYLGWYLLDKPRWLWGWDVLQGAGDAYVYPVRHSLFEEQPVLGALRTVQRWLHVPFALLAVAGALLALRRGRANVLAVTMLWFTLVYSLLLPDPRYLVPLRSLQAVLAAGAVVWAHRAWRRRARRGRDRGEDTSRGGSEIAMVLGAAVERRDEPAAMPDEVDEPVA